MTVRELLYNLGEAVDQEAKETATVYLDFGAGLCPVAALTACTCGGETWVTLRGGEICHRAER
jgi:hypothetical protein